MFRLHRYLCVLAVTTLASMAVPSSAQTIFWNGSTSNSWGAANWSTDATGATPASFATDADVHFTIVGGGANLSTTLGGNRTINSLTLNANLGSLLTIANNTLTLGAGGLDMSASLGGLTINSAVTLSANQTWLLSPSQALTLTNDLVGSTQTLTIDGGGTGIMNIGETTNNTYNIGELHLTNGATVNLTQDNPLNDYNSSLVLDAGTSYNLGNRTDAFAGLGGAGTFDGYGNGTSSALDLRPNGGESFLFSGSFTGNQAASFQITAGAAQRDLVTGKQMFDTELTGAVNLQILNGTGGFQGVNGAMNLAVGTINIGRNDSATTSAGNLATLLLDSTTGNHASQNRLNDGEQINLRSSGQFQIIGNGSALTTEDVGTLNVAESGSGDAHAILTLQDGGAGVALTSNSLTRSLASSLLIRGDNLGTAAAGAGVTNLIFDTAPTLVGGAAGVGILPYAIGDNSASGNGTDFVTYAANGVRLLTAGEYVTTFGTGANVSIDTTPAALGGNTNDLALKLGGAAGVAVDLGGHSLDLASGAILSTGTGANTLSNGLITAGAEAEIFFHLLQDLTLDAVVGDGSASTTLVKSGSGTLTINQAQTYTGQTSITDGTVNVTGSNFIPSLGRLNVNGVLNLAGGATAEKIGNLSSSARGTLNIGAATSLEFAGGGATGTHFGTLVSTAAGAVDLIKSGSGTQQFRAGSNARDVFQQAVVVRQSRIELLDSSGGRLDLATSYSISENGSIYLNNNLGGNNGSSNSRLSDTAPITMDWGTLLATGSNNARTTETVGAITFNSGFNVIQLDADDGAATASNTSHGDLVIIAADLIRANYSTGLIRGDNLGFAIGGTADTASTNPITTGGFAGDPGGSESNFRITAAPTLSHTELTGTNQGVIPWLIGGGTAGNGGNTLVTYNASRGITLLDITPTTADYSFQQFGAAGTLSSAAIGGQNTYIDFTANNSDAALDGDTVVRGLVIDNTGGSGSDLNLAGFSLTVESGVILSTGTQNNQILVGGEITFGNNAATGYEGHIRGTRTIVIDSPIVDNGANPVAVTLSGNVQLRGDNTFTGPLTVNTGRNYVYAANGSTDRIVDTVVVTVNGNGILSLNSSDETIGGLEGNGFIENYNTGAANDSILTINNAGDHVFEGIVRDGRAAPLLFVKDGAGSQTLTGTSASTYTGTTELKEGTLVLGGGVSDRIPGTNTFTIGDSVDNTDGTLVLGDGLGALTQTLKDVTTVGTGTSSILGGSAEVSTLILDQAVSGALTGNLGGAGTNEGNLALVKNGVGDFTVAGTTTLAGDLTVNGGILTLTGASEIDGAVTVAAGSNILNIDGAGLLGTNAGTVTVGDGAALNFRNGSSIQTFAGMGNVLALDGTSGATVLGFGVDGLNNDQISLATGQTLSTLGTINADVYVSGAPTAGSNYVLINSADDGAFTGGGVFQIGAIFNGGSNIYDVIRESTVSDPDQLILTVTAVNIDAADDAWWNGDINNFWGALNTGGNSNWNKTETGGDDAQVGPDSNSVVHFSTTTAGNYATILDSDTTIEALVFHANSGTNGVSITSNTSEVLTIGNGADTPSLTVMTGGNDSIVINSGIGLGATQSWNIEDGTSVLTLAGGISGAGDLNLNDNTTASGALLLSGAPSTYTGALNVSGGKLVFQDTGSLSSANQVTLASGTSIEVGTATSEATGATLGGLASAAGEGSVIGGSANNSTLIFSPAGTSTYGGSVGGSTGNEGNLNLVMAGVGTQVLDGAVTIAGTTTVQAGTLQLGASAVYAPGGVLSVIADDGATATFDVNGGSFTTVGTTTLGGLSSTATPQITDTATGGLITLGGGITYDGTNDPLGGLIAANLALGGASRTFTVNDSASAVIDLTISGSITETGNFALNLQGTGTGLLSGPVTLATGGTGSDINVNSVDGTWIIENAVSFGDDFNANDGTVIVRGAGQIGAATGDDLLLGNDNDSLPATVELNVANAFVGDDVEVRSGSLLKIGADGALTEGTDAANNPDGMNDLNVGTGGLATPGGSTVDLQGFAISVDNYVLGGRLNSVVPEVIQGNIIDSSAGRTGTITTTANSTLRFGEVSAGLAGTGLLLKEWETDATLSGNNTRTGRTEVRGGNLILDFATATVNTEARLSATDELRMGRNTWDDAPSRLTVNGSTTLDITQAVNNTQFTSGAATIDVNSAGGAMNFDMGAITQNDGATFNLELPVNGSVTTSNADGLLGGWAVVEGSRFATVSGGAITSLASTAANDVSLWAAGDDVINDAAFSGTIACATINSLTFDAAVASSVPITGALDITSGGILVSSNVGANDSTISGGNLATSGGAFYIHQHNTAGLLEISSALHGSSTLSKSGDGELLLSGVNNGLGAVYVQEGTLRVTGGDAIGNTTRVRVMGGATTVFEVTAGQTETVGIIDGGVGGQGTVRINAGAVLTTNYSANDTFSGSLDGAGTFVKDGIGNMNLNGVSSFTGDIVVAEGLFQVSNIGRILDASGMTINKGGALLLDNNGGTRTGDRIGNSASITLNSADGTFNGGTQPRGLAIRTDQNAATNEDIGVLNIASGASYATLEANNNGTTTESQLLADDFGRTAGATLNIRGRDLGNATNVRTTHLRINNASNQTAFIGTLVGGGGSTATNTSIVPWAVGENLTVNNVAATNMGNTLMTYVSGRGFTALDLGTGYQTFSGSSDATDNVRESLTADLTGLTSQTVNALVIHNDSTAASTINVTGAGAGNTLTNTSGTFLFTQNTGAAASSAHSTTLGGFDGIATAGSEYNFFVVNPSSAANTATTTAQIDSPLSSNADIVKSGRGTLIFTAANTAGGGANRTVINEGTLEISALNQIGGTTGDLVFAGGELRLGSGFVDDFSTRTVAILNGGATIDTNGNSIVVGAIGGAGSGDLTKLGAGSLTLSGGSTHTGATNLDEGQLILGVSNALSATGDVRVGNGTTTGELDLNGFDLTIGALSSFSNSTTANLVTVDPGSTLTITGGILLSNNTDNGNTDLTIAGGGDVVVNGQGIVVGLNAGGTSSSSEATLDLSDLNSFTATLSQDLVIQQQGDNNANDPASLILSDTANVVTAPSILIGNSSTGSSHSLRLGAGTNAINTDLIYLGGGGRDSGVLDFSGATGTVVLRDAHCMERADIIMGPGGAPGTGYTTNNVMDVTGHDADLAIGTLTMSPGAKTAANTNTLSFDEGTLDILNVNMAVAKGAGASTNTINIGGGTAFLGGSAAFSDAGTGSVSLATEGEGILAITGGTVTSSVDIVRTAGAGTATINLDGGTLDLSGNSIGSATEAVTLTAASGTLRNLGGYNGGAVLDKTTAGTLLLDTANTYTGGTTVSEGTLLVNNTVGSGTGSGSVIVGSGATLGGSGIISGPTNILGAHSPGNSPGVQAFGSDLTYTGGASSLVWELAGNTAAPGDRGLLFDGVDVGGNLDFGGATSATLTFNGLGSTVDWSDALWGSNQEWLVYDVGGTTSNFGNLSLVIDNWADSNGALFDNLFSGSSFGFRQAGSDVYLDYTFGSIIPEPSRVVLLALGVLGVFFRRRRAV